MTASAPSPRAAALLAGLVLLTSAIAFAAWHTGAAHPLEAIAFVTGVFCVWLVTRQNIWNFPLGITGATALLYRLLNEAGGTATFWDALITSISLAAQWAQSRKILECWWLWIVADILYIPFCLFNGLYLTALLYGVFLVLAIMGLLAWRKAATA